MTRTGRHKVITNEGCYENPNFRQTSYTGSFCTPKVYFKIVARLKRTGFYKESEDIVFLAKYPVQVIEENTALYLTGGTQDESEDIVLGDNFTDIYGTSKVALNTISAGYITNSTYSLSAGQAIILRPGAVITPGFNLSVGQVYSSMQPLSSLHASASDLTTFCNGPLYNLAARNSSAARIGASPEEIKLLTNKNFFSFYPNPARNQVTFSYFIEHPTDVRLTISDMSGKFNHQFINEHKEVGDYKESFDTSGLPGGIYIVVFESKIFKQTGKLVVIK